MSAAGHEILGGEIAVESVGKTPAERYDLIRPLLDVFLALLLLTFLAPFLLLFLILVRLTSKGPAIYTQQRLGRNGRPFTILKVRSMYLDSERDGPRWSLPGDPRVTPVGRFLRWSHMDELPQLLNVLRGEMSMIGPRPERPELVEGLELALPRYRERLSVRPGLTGLAQVLLPPDTDLASVARKLRYDLYYIDRRSLWLDFRICIATGLLLLGVPGWLIAALMGFPHQSVSRQPESAT